MFSAETKFQKTVKLFRKTSQTRRFRRIRLKMVSEGPQQRGDKKLKNVLV